MTEPTKQQRVFIVKGCRRILEVAAADILVCDKMTWARVGRRRYLLGCRAFFTRKAAEVRKLGELRKLAALKFPPWHVAGFVASRAQAQLTDYAKTGVLH